MGRDAGFFDVFGGGIFSARLTARRQRLSAVIQRIQRPKVERLIKAINAKLLDIAASSGAKTIDPLPYICNAAECPTLGEDGLPLYGDDSHLRSGYVRAHMAFLDDIVLAENTSTTSDLAPLSGYERR